MAQLGKRLQEADHDSLGLCLEISLAVAGAAIVAECPGDLLRQPVVETVDQIAHMIGHVAQMEVLASSVAGVEDLAQVGQDIDDLAVTGQRRVPEVVNGATFLIGLDDPLSYGGERISRFKVRGHQKTLVEPPIRHSGCQIRRGQETKAQMFSIRYLRSTAAANQRGPVVGMAYRRSDCAAVPAIIKFLATGSGQIA